ncbi:cytochrome P450 [Pseudovirgaria hyperparasitica]|uniref:Cytochrome P450 n=1 Tax=Pseudovirgaria hyperparasitica TaxID=470096 RepID=A0A6A6WB35_9PEZI|nr:cytochrome P450 [Pseudovirgaria hyperparasitica]KAF2760058.1 cytochrome P450 [Pseudovirgaria hyperparasitica]
MTMHFIAEAAILCALLVLATAATRFRKTSQYRLPPSPPGEPLLGHFRLIPADHPEHQYIAWGRKYNSDVLHFIVLGRSIVVLNSTEAAHELLDKRGSNYSDRPRFVLFELMGWGITLTFLRWGPRFRLHRKLLQSSFTPTACKQYRPIQEDEARKAVSSILRDPSDWELGLRKYSTAVIMRIGFGVTIKDECDPYVQMVIDVEDATANGGVPASTLVDFFPTLRHLPRWLLRSGPVRHAVASKSSIQNLHNVPWAATEPEIARGTAQFPSFMRTHYEKYRQNLSDGSHNEASIADMKGAAGAISIAGSNTTWSTIIICILNLVRNPDVQRRAQAEIDSIVDTDRLPSFEDRQKLPYLENVIQETLRWAPLSPLGVPHASIADDVYKGMFIPGGSVVYANAWAMCHDEAVYTDPDEFNPSRYLPIELGGRGEPLPEGPFGFGRRVCIGQHLATAGVYIMIVTLLSVVEFLPPIDEQGNEIMPSIKLSNGLSSHPEHFECRMQVRSGERAALLHT